MTKTRSEIDYACVVVSDILDSYLEAEVYPLKKDVASEAREKGLYITTAHLSGGAKWAEPLKDLTTYAQKLAVSRGIEPESKRGRTIPVA